MYKLLPAASATIALLFTFMLAPGDLCFPAQASAVGLMPIPWKAYMPWRFGNSAPAKTEVTLPAKLEKNMEALARHDIVILIDRSASMQTPDCPIAEAHPAILFTKAAEKFESRWQWCCDQTRDLSGKTKSVLKDGIRVVVFSSAQMVYDNVKIDRVADIFQANAPSGSTNVVLALKTQLDDYFRRRSRPEDCKTPLKPLLIAVITDGCFEHSIPVQRAITEATQRMNSSDEIAITFLQVGRDPQASKSLKDLASGNSVISRKASFGIVRAKSFAELDKVGLTNTLLELVSADTK